MITLNLQSIRNLAVGLFIMALLFNTCTPALAQQHVIANKDVTRPQIQQNLATPANIDIISAVNQNGYNEIQWTSRRYQDVQSFSVEYSTDGINFQSAGTVAVHAGLNYSYQHYIQDRQPMLYRINMQLTNMRNAYSKAFFLDGIPVSPVRLYPTIVTGNTINLDSQWPLERMTIVNTAGSQVYAKELNGQSNYIPVVIPTLGRGMYIVTLYGRGWTITEKLIVS
jgi:hypothetical protein